MPQGSFIALNGNDAKRPRIKPRIMNGKVPSRTRKAVADAAARQAKGVAAVFD